MGNAYSNQSIETTSLHGLILEISGRLLKKYKKLIKTDVCKDLFLDTTSNLKKIDYIKIKKLYDKIFNSSNVKIGGSNKKSIKNILENDIFKFKKNILNKINNKNTIKKNKVENKVENTSENKVENKIINSLENKIKDGIKKKIIKTTEEDKDKESMCKLIGQHYLHRIKIISNILSIVNDKDTNKMCYSQYKSIENGLFCIPNLNIDDYLKKFNFEINDIKIINLMYKHVKLLSSKMDKLSCEKSGGVFISLSKQQLTKILKNKDKYSLLYKKNLKNIKKEYNKCLKKLIHLLKQIEAKTIITDVKLTNINNELQKIIKLMKKNCNHYYITCIFAYIHIKIKEQ